MIKHSPLLVTRKAIFPVLLLAILIIAVAFIPRWGKTKKVTYPVLGLSVTNFLKTVQDKDFSMLTVHLDQETVLDKIPQELETSTGGIYSSNVIKKASNDATVTIDQPGFTGPLSLRSDAIQSYFQKLKAMGVDIAKFDSILLVPYTNEKNQLALFLVPLEKGENFSVSTEINKLLGINPCPPDCPKPPPPAKSLVVNPCPPSCTPPPPPAKGLVVNPCPPSCTPPPPPPTIAKV